MVTTLVRSEKDLRKQAQLAEEIKFFFPKSEMENFCLSVILASVIYSLVTWVNSSNLELFGTLENLHSRSKDYLWFRGNVERSWTKNP